MINGNWKKPREEFDLTKEHYSALEELFEPKVEDEFQEGMENPWKIIIFDKFTQQSLSTLFKVGDLRKKNITLHLRIENIKEEITGVETLCFLSPGEETIRMLGEAIRRGFLNKVHINFLGFLNDIESGVQLLADVCGTRASSVASIHQFNLNFVSLGKDIFSLASSLGDKDCAVQRMHSFIKFMNVNPIIVHQEDDKVREFCEKLKNVSLRDTEGGKVGAGRVDSALVLYTRNFDMAVALHHSSLYQPLIAEEYTLRFNKAVKGEEVHDLDVRNDDFWQKNSNRIFPEVADDLKIFLSEWRKEYESISTRQMTDDMQEFTESIFSALDLVPEMNDRRKRNETHTKILGSLVTAISERKLDEFHSVEITILQGHKLKGEDLDTFNSLISMDAKNSQELTYDKIRLFIIYIFGYVKLDSSKTKAAFSELCSTSKILENQKIILEKMMIARLKNESVDQSGTFLNQFALQSLDLVKGLMRGDQGSKIEGIVNKVAKKDFNIEGFGTCRMFNGAGETLVSDVKLKNVIVYCIDNGSYIEYDSISKLGQSLNKTILYGAGSLSSPSEILDHLFES